MALKDKQQLLIKEIVKSAGTLDSAAIKERVCAKLGISMDEYAKPTYLRHLKELVDTSELQIESRDGKNLYSVEADGTEIQGSKYVLNRGGKINVPKIVSVAGVSIKEGSINSSEREISIFFEMNYTLLCLNVSRDAFPFKLHLSRVKEVKEKQEILKTVHGQRTIFLEVPVTKVSAFKDETQTGHLIIEFLNENEIEIKDLGSTNGSSVQGITPGMRDELLNEAHLLGKQTVQTNGTTHDKTVITKPALPLEKFKTSKVRLPAIVSCSSDFRVLVIS
jgi:hypothetical protein